MIDQPDCGRAARREAMLPELIAAMKRHHCRRRFLRRLQSAAALVLVAVAGASIARHRAPAEPDPIAAPAGPSIVVVGQDYRTGLVRVIDDDELVRRLAEINRPAGLVRAEGRVWLTGTVADARLETPGGPEPQL
jgi:hypothetical protein